MNLVSFYDSEFGVTLIKESFLRRIIGTRMKKVDADYYLWIGQFLVLLEKYIIRVNNHIKTTKDSNFHFTIIWYQ